MATLSCKAVCLATLAHHGVTLLLLCFSLHDMVIIILLILKNVHGPVALALFITPVTVVLHNSMVSFMCSHVFFSSLNQQMLLNYTEYGRA